MLPSGERRTWSPSFAWLKCASLELTTFWYVAGHLMVDFAHTNLYLRKACRPNATVDGPDWRRPSCDDHETAIRTVATINAYVHPAKILVVIGATVLYAAWSDAAGRKRKPFIVLPPLGLVVEAGLGYAYAGWWSRTSTPTAAAIAFAAVYAAFGGYVNVYTFANMYVADVVDARDRTAKLGLLTAARTAGHLLAKGVCGWLLHAVGFRAYYAACAALGTLAFAAATFGVDDISVPARRTLHACSIFDVRNAIESCKVILGAGTARQKCIVTLLCTIFPLLLFIHEGQQKVMYLYLRYQFGWDELMYSWLLFGGIVGTIVGSLFSAIVLSKILQIHDSLIGIIASLWDAGVAIAYIFAYQDWHLFLISGLDVFYGVSISVCVSLVTKFYDSSQMGHLFAVKTIFCLAMPLCYPAYNILFTWTLHTKPYAFFYISFGLYLMSASLYGLIWVLMRKRAK